MSVRSGPSVGVKLSSSAVAGEMLQVWSCRTTSPASSSSYTVCPAVGGQKPEICPLILIPRRHEGRVGTPPQRRAYPSCPPCLTLEGFHPGVPRKGKVASQHPVRLDPPRPGHPHPPQPHRRERGVEEDPQGGEVARQADDVIGRVSEPTVVCEGRKLLN